MIFLVLFSRWQLGLLSASGFFRFARKPAIFEPYDRGHGGSLVHRSLSACLSEVVPWRGWGRNAHPHRSNRYLGKPFSPSVIIRWWAQVSRSFSVGDRQPPNLDEFRTLMGINEAHNGYLEIYLSLGWIGVALLVGLIHRRPQHYVVFRRDPKVSRLRLAFFATAIVYAFTEAGFRIMCPLWTAFLLSIIAVPNLVTGRRPRPLKTGKFSHADAKLGAGLPPREIVTG